ncbi:MAG: DUF4339 domain-containing protein [Acidobacteria bacterium]|nr:DUF4339 domain-containing protein [Acidobacteriota bacterium]
MNCRYCGAPLNPEVKFCSTCGRSQQDGPASDQASPRYYYADSNNSPVGPYPFHELKQLLISERISNDTQIVEEGGSAWKPFRIVLQSNSGGAMPTTGPPAPPARSVVTIGNAILWLLCCLPIGFSQWGQGSKGWIWFLIVLLSGGLGIISAWIDYFMAFSVQQRLLQRRQRQRLCGRKSDSLHRCRPRTPPDTAGATVGRSAAVGRRG